MRGMHSKESAQHIIIEACKNMAEVSMFNDKAKTAVDKAKRCHNSKKIGGLDGQLALAAVSVLPAVVAPFYPSSTTTCASPFVFFTVPFSSSSSLLSSFPLMAFIASMQAAFMSS
jgi:hypothetical protein